VCSQTSAAGDRQQQEAEQREDADPENAHGAAFSAVAAPIEATAAVSWSGGCSVTVEKSSQQTSARTWNALLEQSTCS